MSEPFSISRRNFVRLAAIGTAAGVLADSRLLAGSPTPSRLPEMLSRLKTAEEMGVVYLRDSLRADSPDPAPLTVHTHLADPGRCGRRAAGWSVRAGVPDAYTSAVLRERAVLGNRSQLARFSFRSTQEGVAKGQHGLVEMRLCRGTTPDDVPVRIRVENGAFYILSLNQDTLLAGDPHAPVFPWSAGVDYTLTVLLFAKAVYARLEGKGVPHGAVERVISDRRRFIPGLPGFGLRPNPIASAGELTVFDWTVTPVGPGATCRLGAIGDSITAGNDSEPEAESYVHLATRALGQEHVLNTGSGGSTTTLDLARLPYEIAPFKSEIVWIEGGTNDVASAGADAVFQNMMRMSDLIAWGGTAVISTVPPRPLPSRAQQAELERLNRLIRESGRPVIDRYACVVDPVDPRRIRAEFRKPDEIHITKAGHARIAEEAVRVFRGLGVSTTKGPAVQARRAPGSTWAEWAEGAANNSPLPS